MNHKSNSTNNPCSSSIKKATWVTDQGTRANNSDSFLFLRNQIQKNEVINLFKRSKDSGQFIVKNASVFVFPDTPIEENRKISEMSINQNTVEPMFQIGGDRVKMRRRYPITIFKEGKDPFGERTVKEEMLGIIFSPTT